MYPSNSEYWMSYRRRSFVTVKKLMELRYLLDLHPALIKNSFRWRRASGKFSENVFSSFILHSKIVTWYFLNCMSRFNYHKCRPSLKFNCHLMLLKAMSVIWTNSSFSICFLPLFSISVSTVIIALEASQTIYKVILCKY